MINFSEFLKNGQESTLEIDGSTVTVTGNIEINGDIELTEAKANLGKQLKLTNYTIGDILVDLYNKFGTGFFKGSKAPDLKNKYIGRTLADQIIILAKWDMLEKTPAGYRVTIAGEKEALKMGSTSAPAKTVPDEPKTTVANTKAIKNLGKTKGIKFKVPKVSKSSKYLDQMTTLLDHMDSSADGTTKKTYMLAGDPGTGKTSFIESLGTLTGIPLVVIEAPHITQEHLINIPFLVIDGPKRREGNIAIEDHENPDTFKIVTAESALVTTLKTKQKRSPEKIQTFINQNKVLREMQPLLQYEIDLVKDRYNSILFLDEFYRTTSKKIRNVLRNILNGKIGDDKIPKGTYIIMATNINDEGIDDIPENHDFNLMKYDTPDKEDLFNYLYGKYVDNPETNPDYDPENPNTRTGVAVKPEVFNAFFDMVRPGDLGKTDEVADVRLSPRRLEQMLIYVDSQTPCLKMEDAASLVSYITNSLSNYLEDSDVGRSNMVDQYVTMIKKIINETSDLPENGVDSIQPLGKTEWAKVLSSQIDAKLKLGDAKKYVPIVSGDPGIGKTSAAVELARTKNMGFIQVDISNRSPEDFSGMPNADMNGPEITVEFTEPALYRLIMSEYNQMPEAMYKGATHVDGEWQREGVIIDKSEFTRPYNVLLLFDEMNRTTPAVFNSMRKILLEKQFSDSYTLPPDIMMMGAINPKGEGTMEFTSHTRDVLDIIPASADFGAVMTYAKNGAKMQDINKKIGFELSNIVTNVMTMLGEDFHSTTNSIDEDARELETGEQPFWWTLDGQIVYISGREFTEAVYEIVAKTQKSFRRMGWDVEAQYDEKDYDKFISEAINIFAKYLGMGLNMVVIKMQVEDFVPKLQGRIIADGRIETFYKVIKDKASKGQISLLQMMKGSDFNEKVISKKTIGPYLKWRAPEQMTQDVEAVINSLTETKEPIAAAEKILDIVTALKNALKGTSANYNYTDKLNKHVKFTMAAMIENGKLPLITLLKDEKLLNSLESLSS